MASFDPMAASQIDVDPAVGDGRYEALVKQLIARGLSPAEARKQARAMLESPDIVGQRPIAVEEAELNAMQDAAQPQINSYRAGYTQPAPGTGAWKAQERSMGMETLPFQQADEQGVRDEFYRRFGREPSSYREIEMMREMMAEQSASQLRNDLAQGGYGQRMVPGPRGIDGRAPMGKPFASVEDAQEYEVRQQMDNGGFGDSQRDQDMRARGFSPVIGPGGNATYMLTGTEHSRIPGAPGRAGERPDLAGKYRIDYRQGIGGDDVPVMVPTEEFKVEMKKQGTRIKDAQKARKATRDARMERFLAQLQLGGGRQTPQAIATERMLYEMSPEQRKQAMRYMAPGGQLAAMVDAQSMQNANAIFRHFMTSGAAGLMNTPLAQAQANVAAIEAETKRDAARAPDEDVLGEKYARGYQLPWWLGGGYDEFTIGEQQQMYDELIARGYSAPEAQRAVDRQAQKRRATDRMRWGAAPAPSASPPAVVPPGSVPPV